MFSKRLAWLYGLTLIVLGTLALSLHQPIQGTLDDAIGGDPKGTWPTVQGEVAKLSLSCDRRPNGEGDWLFDIGYRYQVQGVWHTASQKLMWYLVLPYDEATDEAAFLKRGCGDIFRVADGTDILDFHEDGAMAKSRYAPGDEVRVHYNASNPSDSVIRLGIIAGMETTYGVIIWIYLVMAGWFGGAGLLVYAGINWRSSRKSR